MTPEVAQALEIAEDGWKAAAAASEAAVSWQAQCVQLQEQLAKRASTPQLRLDPTLLAQTLDMLEANPRLQIQDRQKLAAAIAEDPNKILDLVARLAMISSAPRSEGRGVSKAASDGQAVAGYVRNQPVKADPHGFSAVILEGAN